MDERKWAILNAIINSYILNPNPVGSRTISKEYDFGVSPATIRNEMADLEDLGYLVKPHTSSGRIPSDKAYRLYVDNLVKNMNFDKKKKDKIKTLILDTVSGGDEIYEISAKLLAEISDCTAYVLAPKKRDTRIKYIELLPLETGMILLLLVGNHGEIEKSIIVPKEEISEEELEKISNLLNRELTNIDFERIHSLKVMIRGELSKHKDFIREVVTVASNFNKKIHSENIYFEGLTNMLNHEEYKNFERAREFMEFMENRENILSILKAFQGKETEVIIGSEIENEFMQENSMINSLFANKTGQIGIVGPVRMNYAKLIDIIEVFSASLTDIVENNIR